MAYANLHYLHLLGGLNINVPLSVLYICVYLWSDCFKPRGLYLEKSANNPICVKRKAESDMENKTFF